MLDYHAMRRPILDGEKNHNLADHLLHRLARHVKLPPAMNTTQPLSVTKLLLDVRH